LIAIIKENSRTLFDSFSALNLHPRGPYFFFILVKMVSRRFPVLR